MHLKRVRYLVQFSFPMDAQKKGVGNSTVLECKTDDGQICLKVQAHLI